MVLEMQAGTHTAQSEQDRNRTGVYRRNLGSFDRLGEHSSSITSGRSSAAGKAMYTTHGDGHRNGLLHVLYIAEINRSEEGSFSVRAFKFSLALAGRQGLIKLEGLMKSMNDGY